MKTISKTIAIAIILAQVGSAQTTPTVGWLDDNRIHLPLNYNDFLLPPAGVTMTDPLYGTKIYRVTNGLAQLNDAVHHEYATVSPFNKNNTMLLLLTDKDGFLVADRFGEILYSTEKLGIGGLAEPRWSTRAPDNFYYHTDNRLLLFDTSTGTRQTIRTFAQFNRISFGGGEGDLSEDGDHIVIIGDQNFAGVYEFSSDTLGPLLNIAGRGFDYFDLTPNNNVIVRWGEQGTARYQGIEMFDQKLNFIRQVVPFSGHADRTHDMNDDEVLILAASNDPAPPAGCENNGIEKIRLTDSKKTCLLALNYDSEIHVSTNRVRNNLNPWVLVSTTDNRKDTAAPANSLPADWQQRWGVRYNELILVKLDGSEVRRLAHHRSRVVDDYWYQPRAALSRDGAFAVFDSNFGAQPFYYYTDVFWINLTGNVYEVAAVSAAAYNGTSLAPDSLAAGFGTNLTTVTLASSESPLPTALGSARVYLRDSKGIERYAPLLYVSPTQVNFQVPSGMALGPATITVLSNEGSASMGKVQITDVKPGLFTADATGTGWAAATVQRVKADNSQSFEQAVRFDLAQNQYVAVPIDLGAPTDQVFLNLFGTGVRHRSALSAVTVSVGGIDVPVGYAGDQIFFVGVDQVNVALPRSLIGRGEVEIVLRVDGQVANTVKVFIK